MSGENDVLSSALTENWKPKYDLRDGNVEQHIMDAPPSHQSVQALLQRGIQKFSDEIKLSVEVQGIYGIPDDWTTRIEDPAEQAFQYEVRALGTHLVGGKLVAKEEPDAGAAVDDGKSKNQKAPPPKGKGKAEL